MAKCNQLTPLPFEGLKQALYIQATKIALNLMTCREQHTFAPEPPGKPPGPGSPGGPGRPTRPGIPSNPGVPISPFRPICINKTSKVFRQECN